MDNSINQQEKVLLIGIITHINNKDTVKEHLSELSMLVETAGGKVVGQVTQKISRINPATLVGAGKASQIFDIAKVVGA